MDFIYADVNATHPCSKEHLMQVWDMLQPNQGNPSSIHPLGRRARLLVERSRRSIAECIGAQAREIFFTSCATESNNWVLQAVCARPFFEKRPKLLISAGEHSSIRVPAAALEKKGLCEVVSIGLQRNGQVDEEALLAQVDQNCVGIFLIHTHNETGVVNDVESLAIEAKKRNPDVWFHIDAVQSLGKVELRSLGGSFIDSVSFSAHKIGGLQGVGCLYKKEGRMLSPLLLGGGQERALRSGTQNVAGIVSFGLRAAHVLHHPDWLGSAKLATQRFQRRLQKMPHARIHVSLTETVGTVTFFCLEGIPRERLLVAFEQAGICVSAGSACGSGTPVPNPTLLAMGIDAWAATHSVRVSFGEANREAEADRMADIVEKAVFAVK